MKTIIVALISLFSFCNIYAQNFNDVASSIDIVANYGTNAFGGGISFADFNQDGWDDLTFASSSGKPLYFFINIGGTYSAVNLGINNNEQTKQVLWVDFDNDGDKDFFFTVVNGFNRLYRNNGGGSFTDISEIAGITGPSDSDSFGACFGDYNNDGWLDLYIANRQFFPGDPTNHLYRNNTNGTFTEVSGFTNASNGVKPTFAPVFFDSNQNGKQDIFLAQDRLTYSNDLLQNTGGAFIDVSGTSGVNHYIDGMNAGVADYDNDLDLDIYVTNTPGGNLLLQNDGNGSFTNVAATAGVVANHIGWGGNFIDAENDGDQDLYVCTSTSNGVEPNRFYINTGNGDFTEISGGLPGDLSSSYGNAIGDFNNDGKMDIAVCNSSPNHFVWRNDNSITGNWLKIDLMGTVSNRDGIGAWVEVDAGGETFLRYKHCGEAYLAQNANYLHVGLGNHTQIDQIRVNWLSGNQSVVNNISANQRIQIVESNEPLALEIIDFRLASIEDNAFNLLWKLGGQKEDHLVTLQKSTTGLDFEDIISDNTREAYRDWDVQKNLQYYYRLKITDETEKIQYSDVITASLQVGSSILNASIFPNPTDKFLNLQINSFADGAIIYSILDSSGRLLSTFSNTVELGINEFQFEIESLNPNQYYLQIEFKNEVIIRPFTKF